LLSAKLHASGLCGLVCDVLTTPSYQSRGRFYVEITGSWISPTVKSSGKVIPGSKPW